MNAVPTGKLAGIRVMADIVARTCDPAKFSRWEELTAQAGYCRRPVRLKGNIKEVNEATGQTRITYSTTKEPDGVLLKACGTRRESLCPPCSATYKADAYRLIEAGLAGGKGVPETVSTHPACFVTLTAGSYGKVHSANTTGSCTPGNPEEHCSHGRPRACTEKHESGDEAVGSAICPECYDFEGSVSFNACVSELYRRTMIYTARRLGNLIGISVRELPKVLRLSYVKVIEFQSRGVVHVHALIRLDGVDPDDRDAIVAPPQGIGVEFLKVAIEEAAARVSAPLPTTDSNGEALRSRWGRQVDVKIVRSGTETTQTLVARYLAKYSVKGTDPAGLLDHRLRVGDLERIVLPEHLRRLATTCWQMGDREEWKSLNLKAWSHMLGARGHFMTKSRRWSTTLAAIRAERQQFVLGRREEKAGDTGLAPVVQIKQLRYVGMGYSTLGDAVLVQGRAEERVEGRRARWEARFEYGARAA